MQAMCTVLSVSRAGFYAWLKRPKSQRQRDDKLFIELIKNSFEQSRQTYGHRRIHADLKAKQSHCGRDRVRRLMRENQLRPQMRKRFKATTDSKHSLPIAENYLARQFSATARHQQTPWLEQKLVCNRAHNHCN